MESTFLQDGTQAWPIAVANDCNWAQCMYLATSADAIDRAVRRARLWTPSKWVRVPMVLIGSERFAPARRISELDPIMTVAIFRFSRPLADGGAGAEVAFVWTRRDSDSLIPSRFLQWLQQRDWARVVEDPRQVGVVHLSWDEESPR